MKLPIMPSETSIIKQCLKGNRASQKMLYDEYRSIWFMICLRYIKNRTESLDVLQNSLVKIYGKLETFKANKGSFKSWSCKIVVNECIMYQRKYWNKNEVKIPDVDMLEQAKDALVLEQLQAEELTILIQNLPDGYRTIFNMYVVDGYSHKEIADTLNISEGTSKSQLYKAKKMLRIKIESIYSKEKRYLSQRVNTA